MKKTVLYLLLVSALSLALTGCWGSNNAPSDKPAPTATTAPSTVPSTMPSATPGQSANPHSTVKPSTTPGTHAQSDTTTKPSASAMPGATAAPRWGQME